MSRHIGLPLVASGLALLALAATIIPFEATAIGLAASTPWERITALQSAVLISLVLVGSAGIACWCAPRNPVAPILLALALGALGGTTTLVTMPDLLGAGPAQSAFSAR